jgi:histidyl-tRNA synthetase
MPEMAAPLDDFLRTVDLLDELGIKYQVIISSGAGFEYYTGIIFQFFIGGEKVGGGGRYDELIPAMGGGDIPASGFALYLDRLMGLVKPETIAAPSPERITVRPASGDALKAAFEAADSLRRAGYIVETDLGGGKSAAGWTVEVTGKSPAFILVEKSGRLNLSTIDELLKVLVERNAG